MSANFINVESNEDLEKVFEESNGQPVVLFKHSLSCPISKRAYGEISNLEGDVYLIVVQHSADVSETAADKLGIRHETPQAIVIKDGKPVYNASHYDVSRREIIEAVEN